MMCICLVSRAVLSYNVIEPEKKDRMRKDQK